MSTLVRRARGRIQRRLMDAEPFWRLVHRVLGLQRPLRHRAVPLADLPAEVGHVLVPGAAVLADGTISQVLQERLDRAVEVATARPALLVVVSGDGRPEAHAEDRRMKEYLVAQGVAAERVVRDPDGRTTRATMERARAEGVRVAVVTTNDFHAARAVQLAVVAGIDAHVVSDHVARGYTDADRPLRWDERRELVAHVSNWLAVAVRHPVRALRR